MNQRDRPSRQLSFGMRYLPRRPRPTATETVGKYLDLHGQDAPISLRLANATLRWRVPAEFSDEDLERLIVEMCWSRQLPVRFGGRERIDSEQPEDRA